MDAYEIDSVLSTVVSELLDAAEITKPPVDPTVVSAAVNLELQHEGVEPDVWPPMPSLKADIVRARLSRATGTAFVMAQEYQPRRNFAVAHEIAEFVVPRIYRLAAIGESFTPQLREFLCDRLASHLLLPAKWFDHDCRRLGFDLFGLRSIYTTVSHEVIARRMTDVEPCIITIFDAGRRGVRLPHRWAPMQSIESRAQREAHETGEVARQSDEESGLTAVAWPVHDERGRKREIVRLTWPEWAA